MVYGLVEMLLPFFFYYILNWRIVYIILGVIPAILGLSLVFFVDETPQYYLSKN